MEFKELVIQRRSIRVYEDTDISENEYKELIETTLMAPTWRNSETGRYYLINSKDKLETISKCLTPSNQVRSKNAKLIVCCYEKNISGFTEGKADNECGNLWGAYDLGLQSAYLILKAKDMGYDTLIMGLRDADALRKELAIPSNYEVMSVIAFGKGNQIPVNKERKAFDEVTKIY